MGVRKIIAIPTEHIGADLVDFPLLVKITADADIGAVCESDGSDVVFYTAAGDVIPFQKIYFSVSGGEATGIWQLKFTCTSAITAWFYCRAGFGDTDLSSPTAVWESSCKAHWGLDATSGTCPDSTSNGHNLTASGTISYSNTGAVYKAIGTSAGYMYAADHADWPSGTNDFTIALWFNGTSFGEWWRHSLVTQDEGAGNTSKNFFSASGSDNKLIYHPQTQSGSQADIWSSVVSLTTGTWHFGAVTRSGNTFSFYFDGAPAGTSVNSISLPNVNAPMCLGFGEDSLTFDGYLDHCSIYNEAKSAEWMRWAYYNGLLSGGGLAIVSAPSSSVIMIED